MSDLPHRTMAPETVAWLAEAISLENQIFRQARRAPNGEVVWLRPRSSRSEVTQPVRLGSHLYDGITGLTLFLAAMEHVQPREGRRSSILSALTSLRHHLKERIAQPEAARQHRHPLGCFAGLGGYLYGFALIGRWLGEPELIAEAAEIATLITPDQIAADEALDVMNGCAGTGLALLALDRIAPDPVRGQTPAERAIACGEHLYGSRVVTGEGCRAWACNGKPPACGFAHGATGISCFLARLFERTGDPRFREAAEEGVVFEHYRYHEDRGWPVPGLAELSFMNSWCNGAPGIALGRLGAPVLSDVAGVQQDLQAALRLTQMQSSRRSDTLCCGHMGNVEVLLEAYEALREEHLLQAAEVIASAVASRLRDRSGDDFLAPDFFRGAAGMAYTFLRLTRSFRLPSILAITIEA